MSDNIKFFEDYYDVVIIGGALAGCSAAITLAKKNFKVLVLEQHNLPGGVATSFVRGGEEYEASLHEMNAYGKDYEHLFVSDFFKEHNINIEIAELDDCYRYVDGECDVLVHHGSVSKDNVIDYSLPAADIASVCDDKDGKVKAKLKEFMELCSEVVNESNDITKNGIKVSKIFSKYMSFLRTSGYSAQEVIDKFNFPKKVERVLTAYFNYLGTPIKDLPFIMFASIIDGYMGHSGSLPVNYSYELGLRLADKAEELGVQIEYRQRVDKILVKDNQVYGVKTAKGEVINCKYVICGTYPNNVFKNMIEPASEIPKIALKYTNSKDIGLTVFSVTLLLDATPEELNITDYATFNNFETLSVDELWENGKTMGPYKYLTTVCVNKVYKKATKEGRCIFQTTFLPHYKPWEESVTMENYKEIEYKLAREMLEAESKRLGVNLFDHILEITYESPITVAHYTGAYLGCIYGYRHSMDDHIVARTMQEKDEEFIKNLIFTGATAKTGDGMGPQFMNGTASANKIIEREGRA